MNYSPNVICSLLFVDIGFYLKYCTSLDHKSVGLSSFYVNFRNQQIVDPPANAPRYVP